MHFIVASLDVSCHSVRMSCWIKRLLTYLLTDSHEFLVQVSWACVANINIWKLL